MGTSRRLAGSDDGVGMTDRCGWLRGGENQQNHTKSEGPLLEAHPRPRTLGRRHGERTAVDEE